MAKKKNTHVLSPSDVFGGPKLKSLNRKQWLMIIGIFLFALVIVNNYFLLKPNSKVERIYSLTEYEWQTKKNYKHFLTKQSVVASKEVITITANAAELDQVNVKSGQMIYTNDPLAVYNESTRAQLIREREIELNAYNTELVGLNNALKEVERQAANQPSNSSIDAERIGTSISLQVQMEIVQNNTSSEASAVLMQHIAELNRKIEITRKTLDDLKEAKSITSPINGSIGDIIYADGSVTFEIHSSEKNIIAYLSEQQWREVKVGQSVIVEVQGHDEPVKGVVIETQEYPAGQSVWLQRLIQEDAIQQDETVYEIRIDANDLLLLAPFNSLAEAEITIQEVNDSYIVPSHWIVYKEVEGVSNEHIYIIDHAGKVRLEPITVLYETSADAWGTNNTVNDEGDEEDKVAKHQLNDAKDAIKNAEKEPQTLTAFTMSLDNPTALLNNDSKRIQAASFLPLTHRHISFDEVVKITWKDVVKYLFY